jgi:hypothetical protein
MEAILLSVAVRTLVAGTPLLLGTLGRSWPTLRC